MHIRHMHIRHMHMHPIIAVMAMAIEMACMHKTMVYTRSKG